MRASAVRPPLSILYTRRLLKPYTPVIVTDPLAPFREWVGYIRHKVHGSRAHMDVRHEKIYTDRTTDPVCVLMSLLTPVHVTAVDLSEVRTAWTPGSGCGTPVVTATGTRARGGTQWGQDEWTEAKGALRSRERSRGASADL